MDFKTVFVFVLAQLEGPPQNFGESVPKPPKRPFWQISFIFLRVYIHDICKQYFFKCLIRCWYTIQPFTAAQRERSRSLNPNIYSWEFVRESFSSLPKTVWASCCWRCWLHFLFSWLQVHLCMLIVKIFHPPAR